MKTNNHSKPPSKQQSNNCEKNDRQLKYAFTLSLSIYSYGVGIFVYRHDIKYKYKRWWFEFLGEELSFSQFKEENNLNE